MINCAHPTHFEEALAAARPGSSGCAAFAPMRRRAATPSSTRRADLDDGDPVELGQQYRALRSSFRPLHRARRLLRHRPPPRRADLLRLQRRRRGGSGGLTPPWIGMSALTQIANILHTISIQAFWLPEQAVNHDHLLGCLEKALKATDTKVAAPACDATG